MMSEMLTELTPSDVDSSDLELLQVSLATPPICMKVFRMFAEFLRNELNFWNVHGIMKTSGLLQSK